MVTIRIQKDKLAVKLCGPATVYSDKIAVTVPAVDKVRILNVIQVIPNSEYKAGQLLIPLEYVVGANNASADEKPGVFILPQ